MQNYIKELEAKLESVCGKYESDCNSCPHKRLCDSYSDGVANNNIQNDFINPTGTNKE